MPGGDDQAAVDEGISRIDNFIQNLQSMRNAAGQSLSANKAEIDKAWTSYKKLYNDSAVNKRDYNRQLAAVLPGVGIGIVGIYNGATQKPQDAFAISAGVMDLLGGMSSAAPPPFGALLSSLFSLISIFVKAFAPKPESLLSQIDKVVRIIKSEENKAKVRQGYNTLVKYGALVQKVMEFETPNPVLMDFTTKDLNLLEGNTMFAIGEVRGWLEETANQDLDLWPEILRLLCDSYLQLLLAVESHSKYVRNFDNYVKYNRSTAAENLQGDWVELMDSGKWVKPGGHPEGAHSVEFQKWQGLVAAAYVKELQLAGEKKDLLDSLKRIVPVARKHGLFVAAYRDAQVWVASGPRVFAEDKFKEGKIREHCRRLSITPPAKGLGSPQYEFWAMDGFNSHLTHDRLDIQTRKLVGPSSDIPVRGPLDPAGATDLFWDVWPAPGSGADGKFAIYAAKKDEKWLRRFDWDSTSNSWQQDKAEWALPTGSEVMSQVRVVGSVKTFDDDPSKDKLPKQYTPLGSDGTRASIIYGALENSPDIWVAVSDAAPTDHWLVPTGMNSYAGIAVDQYLLWVYGPDGFYCVTHAEVMGKRTNSGAKSEALRWLGRSHPNGNMGMKALAACEDGTLVLSNGAYVRQTPYRIDFTNVATDPMNSLVLPRPWDPKPDKPGSGWDQVIGPVDPTQLEKLPVLGWPQIQSLMNAVGKPQDYVS